jgi:U32 family peptidase
MNPLSNPPVSAKLTAPELLAPAGDWDCVRAAIENGANAVYFGLDCGFNARARATNFALADLPKLMETLHSRGLKGYTTFNTLLFTAELSQAEQVIREIAASGVDALLVQDIGVVRLIRAICPDLPIHASTQMSLTSAETIAFAEALGVERVVLARELSIEEIVDIRSKTTMPLEVFVHGALCVAYSGQCLTSESLGGRSANRGQCAQACRLPYDLLCDGRLVDLGEQKYLLSPQDLAAYALAPELIAAGICSFKIEGRLKTAEYVANITKHYRQAIDLAMQQQPVQFTSQAIEEMELSFSRGFSHGWLEGNNHKVLVPAISSDKRGVMLGKVVGISRNLIQIQLASSIKRGDGIAFAAQKTLPETREQGGRVYEVFVNRTSVMEAHAPRMAELAFKHDSLDFNAIAIGQTIWKTDDPALTHRLRKSFTGEPQQRMPIVVNVTAKVGETLAVSVVTDQGVCCEVRSETACQEAKTHCLTQEVLTQQLGRLGGTPYVLQELTANIIGRPMLPLSQLGKVRHALIAALNQALMQQPVRRISPEPVLPGLRSNIAQQKKQVSTVSTQLSILCRNLAQLQTVLEFGERQLLVDFADIREYKTALEFANQHAAQLWLATPRIQKPGEMGIFLAMAKHLSHGVLVRNFAGLQFFRQQGIPILADFSLNITNELTAELLMQGGVQRVTASYDMNREQLLDLVTAVPSEWLEVVIHQHMPMFHMEHCVFCAVLSPGTNKTNCGRPCDTHVVKLRDRIGMEHILQADVGCRNTLFNAVAQSSAEIVPTLVERGVRQFRLELLDESPTEIQQVIELYRKLLRGEIRGETVWRELNASNRVGVTRGTLEERRNPLAIL